MAQPFESNTHLQNTGEENVDEVSVDDLQLLGRVVAVSGRIDVEILVGIDHWSASLLTVRKSH